MTEQRQFTDDVSKDEIARYNKSRWEVLAQHNVAYSRPMLDLTPESARKLVDPYTVMGDVHGKDVLCLASGGGQQSVAFTLLGANVTVFDISEVQLERDRQAAQHYEMDFKIIQGDMRDLSIFEDDSFDLVWHAFSIDFIPDPLPVFQEVARVLRGGGLYRTEFWNPFTKGTDERLWNGEGYIVKHVYKDGELSYADDDVWEIQQDDGTVDKIVGPREFRHTLSTVLNGLIGLGFNLKGLWEHDFDMGDENAELGSWEHYVTVLPPLTHTLVFTLTR